MIGRTLSHYRITDRLGAGGMGEVYLAEDTKLKRRVALKILPADLAADPGRLARFQGEAEALAALNHPNIVTIYSVEYTDGVHFITMETSGRRDARSIHSCRWCASERLSISPSHWSTPSRQPMSVALRIAT